MCSAVGENQGNGMQVTDHIVWPCSGFSSICSLPVICQCRPGCFLTWTCKVYSSSSCKLLRLPVLDSHLSVFSLSFTHTAFSFAPLPFTADQKIEWGGAKGSHIYLLDNTTSNTHSDKLNGGSWPLVKNQIFLGLASCYPGIFVVVASMKTHPSFP